MSGDSGRPLADHERSRCTAGHVRQMAEEYEALEAENERLRKALSTLDDLRDWLTNEIENGHGAHRWSYQRVADHIEEVTVPAARAALSGSSPVEDDTNKETQ